MSKCRGCRYSFWADIGEGGKMLYACQYILKIGTHRPCPYGEKCTVYEPKRRKSKFASGWFGK